MLASLQTSFGVPLSRIHFSPRNECVTNELQRTSAVRLEICKVCLISAQIYAFKILEPLKVVTTFLSKTKLRLRVNRRNNSQYCCANNVGSCCVRVGSGVQTDATTPNNVGACSASWERYNP